MLQFGDSNGDAGKTGNFLLRIKNENVITTGLKIMSAYHLEGFHPNQEDGMIYYNDLFFRIPDNQKEDLPDRSFAGFSW